MSKLNVAIVGCGSVSFAHMKAWTKVPQSKVVAVFDTREKVAREFAQRWRISHYYTQFTADALEQNHVSVVDICTPPQTHKYLGVQAMEAKRHVLFEKPLAMTFNEAKEILNFQRINNVKVSVIHNILFEPVVLKATSLARSGAIGKIRRVCVD